MRLISSPWSKALCCHQDTHWNERRRQVILHEECSERPRVDKEPARHTVFLFNPPTISTRSSQHGRPERHNPSKSPRPCPPPLLVQIPLRASPASPRHRRGIPIQGPCYCQRTRSRCLDLSYRPERRQCSLGLARRAYCWSGMRYGWLCLGRARASVCE